MCAGRRSRPRWTARNWPCRYALCPGLCPPARRVCPEQPTRGLRPFVPFSPIIKLRAGHAHVIGFYRQDSGRCLYELLFLQNWRSACIGCDADILEQHATEQEVHVIGEGVELGKSRLGCSGESGLEINRRTAHRLTAERLPVEADMPELVLGQFFSEGRRSPRLSSLRCRDCPGRIAGGGAPRNCEGLARADQTWKKLTSAAGRSILRARHTCLVALVRGLSSTWIVGRALNNRVAVQLGAVPPDGGA